MADLHACFRFAIQLPRASRRATAKVIRILEKLNRNPHRQRQTKFRSNISIALGTQVR